MKLHESLRAVGVSKIYGHSIESIPVDSLVTLFQYGLKRRKNDYVNAYWFAAKNDEKDHRTETEAKEAAGKKFDAALLAGELGEGSARLSDEERARRDIGIGLLVSIGVTKSKAKAAATKDSSAPFRSYIAHKLAEKYGEPPKEDLLSATLADNQEAFDTAIAAKAAEIKEERNRAKEIAPVSGLKF